MTLLKCFTQDGPDQGTPDKSSTAPQYPLVKLKFPSIIRATKMGDAGDVRDHGRWYHFDDADTSGTRQVVGYAVVWDISERVSNIDEVDENIPSIMFVSSCGQYVQTATNRGDRDQNNHVTLCRATEADLDTLIFILTQMRENL